MSEQPTDTQTPTPAPRPEQPESGSGRDNATRLLMGGSILGVIVVAAIITSIIIFVRGGDEPLVPAGDQGSGATAATQPDQFEPDPFFDEQGRVVYAPLNDNGVLLAQSSPATGRSAATAPSGIMLQRVHGNMYLPFSTSDGPTAFSDTGVATGFARTAQGAGLAAVHYLNYLATGNNRIQMLQDAGLVADPQDQLAEQKAFNASNQPGAAPDNFPGRVMQMIKVNFTEDLARVHIGATTNLKDGRTQNADISLDLVWREGTGWVVQVQGANPFGARAVADFSDGWTSWW
ncbi:MULTISPECIES: hypothetical protein [unclassified Rhodococcus (in: high G+C Gram-positive bacteria)]|uniref:hypothetical protein n=1 Tax=unclassified Rhodococcus (in: high G+C Gram-positive bacteria) TaxID=192944 RepID=UPI000271EF3C|nr:MULTISPECIES: hypothetical protein [unclassified Rhodococcus (in: high G+C Gram-positive bacteria)]EJI98660.1 hypothetical protein JVH1_3916 [Rhodococcus sp. JVH1]KAF0956833.1 hypothetical protein MLGJGCBP_09913 [Rhodococcus sp. T7]KAF0962055.1 hypothetical protein MLGJGCBP_04837 [Rhodococcus sp. T7]